MTGLRPFSRNSLDFAASASVCPVMDNSRDDRLGERFAVLTGILEDAAALASDGQRGDASDDFRSKLVVQIGQHLDEAHALLADIRNILNKPQ